MSASGGWAERTLLRLSLRQRAGQLVMPRARAEDLVSGSRERERLREWVGELGIGGLIVSLAPAAALAAALNELQALAGVPLLVGADMEHGPGQILEGGTRFPPAMALGAAGDPVLAFELGRITAIEGRAAGIHVAFAPVVDVNNNPANPIINTRSYGADAAAVSRMAAAHVQGLQQHGMLATVKHFPGHGDTVTDSHSSLPGIAVDRARADAVELPPFRAAIAAGAAGVMTAHIAFPALTGDDLPATLNVKLISGLLRDELGFDGLVFTDGLDMGAIVNDFGGAAAAVLAVSAGADVLLQPLPDEVESVIEAVAAAVERGAIAGPQLDRAVLRMLRAKERLGLHLAGGATAAVPGAALVPPSHAAAAARAARRSITLLRDDAGSIPLRARRILCIACSGAPDAGAGDALHEELSAVLPELRREHVDEAADARRLDELAALAEDFDLVLFCTYLHISAGGRAPVVGRDAVQLAERIAARRPLVLVSFGSPYVLQQLRGVRTQLLAWAPWEPAQRAAAHALLGRAAIEGRLPIPIPPLYAIGDGIHRAANARAAE
ncbi:MAG: glycoside hydrolase family 3 N-terminal domain-containing protein [Gemmatimonadota bacterium]